MSHGTSKITQVLVHLERLAHNMRLLQSHVGDAKLWPAIKANAYGHGANIVAAHLVRLGYDRLCVADAAEAIELVEAGIGARFIVLSATLPEHAEDFVAYEFEPVVCTLDMVEQLARCAEKAGKRISVHLNVDTGMGRIGIRPQEVHTFLGRCEAFPAVHVKGLMSHFPRADEADKSFSHDQIRSFRRIVEQTSGHGIEAYHLANSAAIFDLPGSYFDAARPGISIYGLKPSPTMLSPRVDELEPVLEWQTRVTYLKEVQTGTGLSYGHSFHARRPSLIATIPVGYGDGLSRLFSNKLHVLAGGERCPLVGNVTMDQSLVDVTTLRGRIEIGDEVVIIGRQGRESILADELAATLGTINYEITTSIAYRVPRVAIDGGVR